MTVLFDDQNLRPMLEATQQAAKIQADMEYIKKSFDVSSAQQLADVEKIGTLVDVSIAQQNAELLNSPAFQQMQFIHTIGATLRQHAAQRLEINEALFSQHFGQLKSDLLQAPEEHEVFTPAETGLLLPETRERIIVYSPAQRLLEELRAQKISLHDLHWRAFEEIVAELLCKDGYTVELGRGTKDGGKDIVATKDIPGFGLAMAVWQAKALKPGNKVDVHVIRELADTRIQEKASKGVIVTTTSLTRGALERIEQDRYLLSKVDGDDLLSWIWRTHVPSSCSCEGVLIAHRLLCPPD